MLNENEQYALLSYYRSRVESLEDQIARQNYQVEDLDGINRKLQEQLASLGMELDSLRGYVPYDKLIKDPGACDRVNAIIKDMQELHGTHTGAAYSWKIQAIKKVREIFQIGLKEAKDWVESQASS